MGISTYEFKIWKPGLAFSLVLLDRMTDATYLFHQTPKNLAKDLIPFVPLVEGDRVIEPFKGEGAFYDALPTFVQKDWAEIQQGRDYQTLTSEYDWVITNPHSNFLTQRTN